MAGSVNLTILLGNVGIDPKIQYTTNGTPVVRFTLATNSQYVDKSTGEVKETTAWHNLVMYGEKPADVIRKHVKKGNPLHVIGHLAYRRWTDNDNVQHNFTQVVIDSFTLLSRRPASPPNEAPLEPAGDNGTAPISVEADNGTELTDDSPF
jgi:single-strand DNA-binding protein